MPDTSTNATDLAASPASPAANPWTPQFTTAAYGKRASTRCDLCSDLIFSEYFKANGQRLCSTCADQARSGMSTASLGSLPGALVFGLVGAIAGMVFYALLTRSTGWTIGYFAIFVGWIVGRAVIAGANGLGSFRIQILAAMLTYLAITLNELPEFFYYAYRRGISVGDFQSAMADIIKPGIISPLTRLQADTYSGGINLVILLIGIAVAWRLTRVKSLLVAGPFDLRS